jgi:hypothetical protein
VQPPEKISRPTAKRKKELASFPHALTDTQTLGLTDSPHRLDTWTASYVKAKNSPPEKKLKIKNKSNKQKQGGKEKEKEKKGKQANLRISVSLHLPRS